MRKLTLVLCLQDNVIRESLDAKGMKMAGHQVICMVEISCKVLTMGGWLDRVKKMFSIKNGQATFALARIFVTGLIVMTQTLALSREKIGDAFIKVVLGG